MPKFKNGTRVNVCNKKTAYLRISAGRLRGKYVHDIVAEAMLRRKLRKDETVEHKDGDGLNPEWTNLVVVYKETNTKLMQIRKRDGYGDKS